MVNPILKKLYDGEIHPFDEIVPSAPGYRELMHKIEDEKEYFLRKLSETDEERFEELYASYFDVMNFHAYEYFSVGYKLGARLTLAVFEDDKITNAKVHEQAFSNDADE